MSFEAILSQWDVHLKEEPRPSARAIDSKATMLAEVGVHKGWNAKILLEMRPQANIVLIDDLNPTYPTLMVMGEPLTKEQRDIWILRLGMELAPVKGRFKFYFEDSLTAVKRFEDETFDYVYLDNDRDTEHISEQMRQWLPKVKKGGILAGSGAPHETVKAALKNVFGNGYITKPPDWWVIK